MSEIELSIGGRRYVLSADESPEHMREVAGLVKRKVEALKRSRPTLTFQCAAILAAFDFASMAINGQKKTSSSKSAILAKADEILRRVETELASYPTHGNG